MTDLVSLEQLQDLAAQLPPEPPKQGDSRARSGESFDLDRWISDHGIEVRYKASWGAGQKWVLARCVWNPEHDDKSAYVVQHQGGAIAAGCHHNSCQGKGWTDFREAVEGQRPRARRSQVKSTGKEEPPDGSGQAPDQDGWRDQIVINNRPLREIVKDTIQALVRANSEEPYLFVRSGDPVRVRRDENGRAIIDQVDEKVLAIRATQAADFVRVTVFVGGVRATHVFPPSKVMQAVLALGEWPFPPLDSVVESPVIRPDGSVLDKSGYDPATRLYYCPDLDLQVPPVPDTPTEKQVQRAIDLISDILWDFPFVDQASRASAWAALFTVVLRHIITGRVPLYVVSAPEKGSGKTLVSEVISRVVTGRPASLFSYPQDDEEEMRKQITTILREGATVVTLDNAEGTVKSAQLARAITALVWSDRILGQNQAVSLPNRATWILNGNNISLGGDLPRRGHYTRLDPKVPHPWLRGDDVFRHEDLEDYLEAHRGELLCALLTLARAWFVAGCPAAEVPPFGSFKGWARVVGGVLNFIGVKEFLGNLPTLYESLDEDTPSWNAFLVEWLNTLGDEAFTVAELTKRLREDQERPEEEQMFRVLRDLLPEPLGAEFQELAGNRRNSFSVKLGHALRRRADVVFPDGVRLQKSGKNGHSGTARWQVVDAGVGQTNEPISSTDAGVAGVDHYPDANEFLGDQTYPEELQEKSWNEGAQPRPTPASKPETDSGEDSTPATYRDQPSPSPSIRGWQRAEIGLSGYPEVPPFAVTVGDFQTGEAWYWLPDTGGEAPQLGPCLCTRPELRAQRGPACSDCRKTWRCPRCGGCRSYR